MPTKKRGHFVRLTDEEWELLRQQADKLGLPIAGYLRLIAQLDVAAGVLTTYKKKTGE
jgi:hypothetical protein